MTASPKPATPNRFSFQSEGFRYEVRGPLLSHADYDSLLLACMNGLRHPFGASEAAAEQKEIFQRASALKRMTAHPVELGVLSWPKASRVG